MAFVVPLAELEFRASRAGGPGGQHVNKASTRVEVLWDVAHSPTLDASQRERLLRRLKNRIDGAGVLRVIAAERRSQAQNRAAALERLQALVTAALHQPKPRRPTRPSRAAKEARLAAKRRRAQLKRLRDRSGMEED